MVCCLNIDYTVTFWTISPDDLSFSTVELLNYLALVAFFFSSMFLGCMLLTKMSMQCSVNKSTDYCCSHFFQYLKLFCIMFLLINIYQIV